MLIFVKSWEYTELSTALDAGLLVPERIASTATVYVDLRAGNVKCRDCKT